MSEPKIEPIDAQALSLAKMLTAHPRAAAALKASIERQQAARPTAPLARLNCPYCGGEGIPYLTIGTGDKAKTFFRRPADCCQFALRDAAENALHYCMNPNNDALERVENADLYETLREKITDPALILSLEEHEGILRHVSDRVTGLARAQGGVEAPTPYGGSRPAPIPFTPREE